MAAPHSRRPYPAALAKIASPHEAEKITSYRTHHRISFDVAHGKILGFAGVVSPRDWQTLNMWAVLATQLSTRAAAQEFPPQF
jgi:ABC-type sugar transport system ATPase subunit